ncbi:hypothetical protein DL96DRAFT_1751918 [Flagelloscypha sp. PMI_526]|nr:hypothetical protein DL96DRAFT_1751918 [Flagelloscypha sp. PMI_526]
MCCENSVFLFIIVILPQDPFIASAFIRLAEQAPKAEQQTAQRHCQPKVVAQVPAFPVLLAEAALHRSGHATHILDIEYNLVEPHSMQYGGVTKEKERKTGVEVSWGRVKEGTTSPLVFSVVTLRIGEGFS